MKPAVILVGCTLGKPYENYYPPPIVEIDLTHRFLPFSPVEAPIVPVDRFQPSLSPVFEDTFDLDFVVPDQQVMPVSTSIQGRGLPSETRV